MEHNFIKLKEHILPLSVADNFESARAEWSLVGVEINEDWDNCPCGKDIKELCYIKNKLNQKETYVGNVCVNRFLNISTGNLFNGLKKIAIDDTANANEDLIMHAYRLGYIYEQEYKFLMDTRRKKKLSYKQIEWKKKINNRIIKQTIVRKQESN